jgi:thiol-disulfide isomerase/thioredoxin
VILAIVTGPWCPNCNDEAQYLVQFYKKYRDRGLEIVALDFEEPEQQDDLVRVHAFIKQYGVEYTYLIEGAPAEMWEKVPQPVNLNTWPATVFVGRNGRVDHVHVGFAAAASREFNDQLKVGVHLHDRAVARPRKRALSAPGISPHRSPQQISQFRHASLENRGWQAIRNAKAVCRGQTGTPAPRCE